MSYVLINGKRYYKDDRTGRITLDNVSQAEADRRAQCRQCKKRKQCIGVKPIAVSLVIAAFAGAFLYDFYHVSPAEEAIADYMRAEQADAASDTAETETAGVTEGQETAADGGP